jgi:hypothetical protein
MDALTTALAWIGAVTSTLAIGIHVRRAMREKSEARERKWAARDVVAEILVSDKGQDELKMTREQLRTIMRALLS